MIAAGTDGPPGDPTELLDSVRGDWVVGTVPQACEWLRELHAAGVERIYLLQPPNDDAEKVALTGALIDRLR